MTANVYAAGLQDRVFHDLLAPAWHRLAEQGNRGKRYLWTLRCAKRGQHVKVRFHGDSDSAARLEALLEDKARKLFAACEGIPHPTRPPEPAGMPAIDELDRQEGLHPDRRLRFTSYTRSAVTFGDPAFLDDDEYCARFTRCLGEACEQVLGLEPDAEEGGFSYGLRQRTLLNLLIPALGRLGFSAEDRRAYVEYHRDWLLRSATSRSDSPQDQTRQVLEHFDRKAEVMGPFRDALGRIASRSWASEGSTEDVDGGGWSSTVRTFFGYVQGLTADPGFPVDSFAPHPACLPLFKVLHGSAHQIGLTLAEEAFAHHLLLRVDEAVDGDSSQRLQHAAGRR